MESSAAVGVHYLVCHDGSTASIAALNTVHKGLLNPDDNMTVANVWSKEKEEYLHHSLKNKYVHDITESQCMELGHRFSFQSRLKDPNMTTKEILTNIGIEVKANITVVGFHGRKGLKEDPTVMGSAVQHLSTNSPNPVLIIKDAKLRSNSPEGAYRFCVCIDGSQRSMEALQLVCRLKQPSDFITVIICEQDNIDAKKVKEVVQYDLGELECEACSTIKILSSEAGRRTADIIREYLISETDQYVDFVFVGNTGADFSSRDGVNKYLGTTSNEIIRNTNINVMFIANTIDVAKIGQ